MTKLFFLFFILISFSCSNKRQLKNISMPHISQTKSNDFTGEWYVLDITSTGDTVLNKIARVIKLTADSIIDNDIMEETSYKIQKRQFIDNYLYLSLDSVSDFDNRMHTFKINIISDDLCVFEFPNPYSLPYSQSYLATLTPKNYKIVDNSFSFESDENITLIDRINMASWFDDCKLIHYIYFSSGGAQLNLTSFSLNASVEEIDDHINLYFSYPIIRPIPENMMDSENYSEEEPIARIELIDDQTLKFIWYGFYNTITKERVHIDNPFGEFQNFSILKKCNDN